MNLRGFVGRMTDTSTGTRSPVVLRQGSPLRSRTDRILRLFLLGEAAAFVVASLVHFGVLIQGYEHQAAATAEGVIGLVLATALAATWISPARTRGIGLASQGFALLGTIVGILTVVAGFGPRTIPDIAYHATITVVLVFGLVVAMRAPKATARPGA